MTASPSDVVPSIETVLEMSRRYSNWGRWGGDDQLGTLNLIAEPDIAAAAGLVRRGRTFSLAIPLGDTGPQTGGFGRFNPIHLMIRDGNDALAGTTPRDFYGGREGHIRSADDVLILPTQCGTQWDGLSHIFHDGKMYNGYGADLVTSKGALRNAILEARAAVVGRGVLLDIARARGVDWLEPGYAVSGEDLDACASAQGVAIRRGDILLIRTGQLQQVKSRGRWADYAGGPAPGLGLAAADWLYSREIGAVATDTWGMEVLPNETPDVFQPLHIVLIVYMGLTVGEIFDLEELAADCAGDGVYEFFFSAPPLPIDKAVASPVNPIAVK